MSCLNNVTRRLIPTEKKKYSDNETATVPISSTRRLDATEDNENESKSGEDPRKRQL